MGKTPPLKNLLQDKGTKKEGEPFWGKGPILQFRLASPQASLSFTVPTSVGSNFNPIRKNKEEKTGEPT